MTFKPKLSYHTRKDGTRAVVIELLDRTKKSYHNTGVYCHPHEWDSRNRCLKGATTEVLKSNNIIRRETARVDSAYIDLLQTSPESVTPKAVMKQMNYGEYKSVVKYINSVIVPAQKSVSSRYGYTLLGKLIDKYKGKGVTFREIDRRWVEQFYESVRKKRKRNSANVVMARLKAVINRAEIDGVHTYTTYPFRGVKLKREVADVTYLSKEQVMQLEGYVTTDMEERMAVDLWLFMYYAHGCRLSDALNMKRGDVNAGVLKYRMLKVGDSSSSPVVKVPIHKKLGGLLEKYYIRNGEYIFPYMSDKVKGKDAFDKEKARINTRLNRTYAVVAEKLGIDKLTPHMARRSFANHLRDVGADMYSIKGLMNHSSESVTAMYLRGEDNRSGGLLSEVYA